MRYDNELNILHDITNMNEPAFLFNSTSLEKKVWDTLCEYETYYVNNSGHDCLPPDFYSDKCRVMFDVVRINDTEKNKRNSPMLRRERNLEYELRKVVKELNSGEIPSNMEFVVNAKPQEDYDKAKNYSQYLKQYNRVVKKHLEKIPLCRRLHPKCKSGLLIFDETDLYFECLNIIDAYRDLPRHEYINTKRFHYPLKDKRFMNLLLDSDLDFVIWASPCKKYFDKQYAIPLISVVELSRYKKEESFQEYVACCLRSR